MPTQTGSPINIAVGPDRNIWFTRGGLLGRVIGRTASITEFPLPGAQRRCDRADRRQRPAAAGAAWR